MIKLFLPLFLTSLSLHTYKRRRSGNGQKENHNTKQGVLMRKETKTLELKTNVTIKGNFKEAVCSVEIYKMEDQKKLVVMMPPENVKDYIGGSTTNFYEEFATLIKRKYLMDISTENITWVDRLIFANSEEYPTIHKEVTMNFDGKIFSLPVWGKVMTDC